MSSISAKAGAIVDLATMLARLPAALGPNGGLKTESKGYGSGLVSVTRPNDTTPYTAGDVVGAALAAITFPTMGPAGGGEVIITSADFRRYVAALISGETSYRLHLYNVTPPSALADNAVWDLPSGDRAAYLGYIDLGTPVDLGATLAAPENNQINKQVTLLSSNLYGYLVTNGGFTPVGLTVNAIGLHAVAP